MDHRMFGITMFVFIIFNIVWRFFNKTPNSFAGSNLESNVEKLVHISMYVLLVSLPILGYSSSMSDVNIYSIDLFSKIYLNQHLNMDIFAFRSFIGGIHKFLTIILLLLVSLHVFVIAFNRIVKKTGELKRMI
jgi:cytochrome b561